MEIRDDDESKDRDIDLIETFNYLLGLKVRAFSSWKIMIANIV